MRVLVRSRRQSDARLAMAAPNTLFSDYDPSRLRAHMRHRRGAQKNGGAFKCASVYDDATCAAPRVQLDECRAGDDAVLEPFEEGGAPSLALVAETPACRAWLQTVDRWVRHTVQQNCEEWFGKGLTPEQEVETHQPIMRDEEGTFRIKLRGPKDPMGPTRVFKLDADLHTWKEGTYEDLQPHMRLIPIVQPTVLWFNLKFGMSLRATDVLLLPASGISGN